MDSSIMTEKEDETVMTSPPPTRIITLKNQHTVKDQGEMLALAQQKFDNMRRRNRERARSSRYQRLSRGSRLSKTNNQDQTKVNQLLSSLLYLSLMMHKVDNMKKILEHRDGNLYNEWSILLGSLHSPVFHMRERRIQNERVKKIYSRKCKYKNQYEDTKTNLVKTQDTLKELSQSLTISIEDSKKVHLLLHERQNVEKDLASTRTESEMRQTQLLKQEDEITNLKSECSRLHSDIEKLQTEQGKLLQIIQTHEHNSEDASKEIITLKEDIDTKRKHIHELESRLLALEKDLESHQKQLSQEQSSHESIRKAQETHLLEAKAQWKETHSLLEASQENLKQLELKNKEEVSNLQQKVTDAMNIAEVKKSELAMTQQELHQTRKDLDSKTAILKETLELIKVEKNLTKCMEEKQGASLKDIASLNMSVERARSENLLLTQNVATLEDKLKNSINEADRKVNSLEEDLKANKDKVVQTEKEVALLQHKNISLEKSLTETLQLKVTAEEQKQQLIDGEANSMNLSIEKLTSENLRITQMMGSMKDSLMQDVHNALEQQKLAEQKADMAQKQLVLIEKEATVLKCTNTSLEKSLSEALQLKSSAEEQKQKLIDGEAKSFNVSIEKLAEENLRINQMMVSMKDSLMQDTHNALEQQKLAEQKVDMLQKQLVETGKELAILKFKNGSLEASLSEALKLKISAEEQKNKLIDGEANSLNLSIQKLSSDNLRLTEMMGSMKDSLINDVNNALGQQKSVEEVKLYYKDIGIGMDALDDFNHTISPIVSEASEEKKVDPITIDEQIEKDGVTMHTPLQQTMGNFNISEGAVDDKRSEIGTISDIANDLEDMNTAVTREAKDVVNMAFKSAIQSISSQE